MSELPSTYPVSQRDTSPAWRNKKEVKNSTSSSPSFVSFSTTANSVRKLTSLSNTKDRRSKVNGIEYQNLNSCNVFERHSPRGSTPTSKSSEIKKNPHTLPNPSALDEMKLSTVLSRRKETRNQHGIKKVKNAWCWTKKRLEKMQEYSTFCWKTLHFTHFTNIIHFFLFISSPVKQHTKKNTFCEEEKLENHLWEYV